MLVLVSGKTKYESLNRALKIMKLVIQACSRERKVFLFSSLILHDVIYSNKKYFAIESGTKLIGQVLPRESHLSGIPGKEPDSLNVI